MISIIIPTYNEEKLIGTLLAHLQSHLNIEYEIIVTDDVSTDRTVEIARELATKVLTPPKKHPTIGTNRNAGAREARGEYLVFIDADIFIKDPDDFFSRALAHFQNRPELVGLAGAVRVLPENETRADALVYTIFNWVLRLKNNILHMGEASGEFQMIRRECFEKLGGFREDLVTREDANMFHRLNKIGRTICDPSLIVYSDGRRAHAVGWPRLLTTWLVESLWLQLFDKSISKEWKSIR